MAIQFEDPLYFSYVWCQFGLNISLDTNWKINAIVYSALSIFIKRSWMLSMGMRTDSR